MPISASSIYSDDATAMIIFLVGFMGCGKSTLGRKAAAAAGLGFADTDIMVEEAAGKTIAEIFMQEGEAAFRRAESESLRKLCRFGQSSGGNLIVATGGGAPCNDENISMMIRSGIVVYLATPPDKLFGQLKDERHKRPKIADLDDGELMEFIKTSLAFREQYYSQAAITIDCNGISDEEIVQQIIAAAGTMARGTKPQPQKME